MEECTLGQVLHGSATTTEAVRRAIQRSQESLRTLAKRHGINPKTVAKWKKRSSVADLSTGPKQPASTVLSIEEEAIDNTVEAGCFGPVDRSATELRFFHLATVFGLIPCRLARVLRLS